MANPLRKEIRSLSDLELQTLRDGYQALLSQSPDLPTSYEFIAGVHGLPKMLCPHGSPFFEPWHRLFLTFFENALIQAVGKADFRLPYWDWTSADSIAGGIPQAFADPTYTRPDGTVVPNPLASAPKGPQENQPTTRNPDDPALLASYGRQVADTINNSTDFLSFNAAIEQPHNNLHVWVGGDMGIVPVAAFDPIFWCHHANVDRQWAIWQAGGNNADPLDPLLSAPFAAMFPAEWNVTQAVSDVVNYHNLGYDYDNLNLGGGPVAITPLDARGVAAFAPPARKTVLRVFGPAMAPDSFKVHVFLNSDDSDHLSARVGNDNFVTTFGIFGMPGMSMQATRAPGMNMDMDMNMNPKEIQRFDITQAVGRAAPSGAPLTVKLVATDLKGNPVDLSQVPITGISIDHE